MKKLPWLDYSGRLSLLKLSVFLALFVPGGWTGFAFATDQLGAEPMKEAIHQLGLWTFRFMLIALAVSPARALLYWTQVLLVRRMLGVAAFAYGLAHLVLYAADQSFDLGKVASEIVLRFYLTIGIIAVLGLAALAMTSTDGMMRRMGRHWQRLHRLVYAIAALGVTHYFIQSKLEVYEPTVMGGLLLWLLGFRVLVARRRDRRVPVWAVAMLGIGSALATTAFETTYFWMKTGVDPVLVLMANLSLDTGVRPGLVVLAVGTAITALAGLALLWRPKRGSRGGTRAPARAATATAAE
ncbi:MAG TPA: protein-methionine-sulfoxide reductase heme-binding subunit MsrQ [Stellaceae bacterium]|nr:protein-methionine-sulfoxide reductase heme-binding subunit MsrQ [Stellaceae bacterium]